MFLTKARLAEIDQILAAYGANPHTEGLPDLLTVAREMRLALTGTEAVITGLRPTVPGMDLVVGSSPGIHPDPRREVYTRRPRPIGEPLTGDDTQEQTLVPNPHPEEELPTADPAATPYQSRELPTHQPWPVSVEGDERDKIRGLNGVEYGAGTHFTTESDKGPAYRITQIQKGAVRFVPSGQASRDTNSSYLSISELETRIAKGTVRLLLPEANLSPKRDYLLDPEGQEHRAGIHFVCGNRNVFYQVTSIQNGFVFYNRLDPLRPGSRPIELESFESELRQGNWHLLPDFNDSNPTKILQ